MIKTFGGFPLSRILNYALGFALIGVFSMSWITPHVISILFTPPVSFGTNCEPAASWSMEKMHISEAIGAAGGLVLGMAIALHRRKRTGHGMPSAQETPKAT